MRKRERKKNYLTRGLEGDDGGFSVTINEEVDAPVG